MPDARGFTLLEVLVVVLLIGIVAGIASIDLGDGGSRERVDRECERFALVVDLAGSEAVLRGRALGVRIESNRYRFFVHVDSAWQPMGEERLLREYRLPPGVTAEIPAAPAAPVDGPMLVFYPDRTATPASVRFTAQPGSYARSLEIDEDGAATPAVTGGP